MHPNAQENSQGRIPKEISSQGILINSMNYIKAKKRLHDCMIVYLPLFLRFEIWSTNWYQWVAGEHIGPTALNITSQQEPILPAQIAHEFSFFLPGKFEICWKLEFWQIGKVPWSWEGGGREGLGENWAAVRGNHLTPLSPPAVDQTKPSEGMLLKLNFIFYDLKTFIDALAEDLNKYVLSSVWQLEIKRC